MLINKNGQSHRVDFEVEGPFEDGVMCHEYREGVRVGYGGQ